MYEINCHIEFNAQDVYTLHVRNMEYLNEYQIAPQYLTEIIC